MKSIRPEKLVQQLINLKPKGVELLAPTIKQEVEKISNEFTATDGYHAALICMNLNIFISLERETSPLDDSQKNFLDSFTIIIKEQEHLLKLSWKLFQDLVDPYLAGEDSENFKEALFHEYSSYSSL